MVADILEEKFGMKVTVAEHGCDTSTYRLTNPGERKGVVFFARPGVARRGFELGVLALQEFHRRHPEQDIHIFGDESAQVPFPAIQHGSMTPARLSELYNGCRAGLAMSFTNVSLVPAEMLACGVIPVVGGLRCPPADLDNPFIRWSDPTPYGLASELCAAIEAPGPSAADVAASARAMSWDSAQQVSLKTIEDEVYGPAPADS
jgi:hypothetical protein